MMPPPFRTRVLGHPVMIVPLMLCFGVCIYAAIRDPRSWPIVLLFWFFMYKVMQAHGRSKAYKQWKRAWDAMEGDVPRQGMAKKLLGVALGLGLVFGFVAVANSNGTQAATGIAIVLGGSVTAFAVLAKLWRWSRGRRPATKATLVAICVTKPLMAVPDMSSAYRSLPEHCLRMLRTPS